MVEVVRLFRDNNIGFVVVSRSPGEYLGTLSERDCCNAVAEHGAEAPMMRVADIMNRNVATCSAQDVLPMVMAIMTERRTRHVLVMDGDALVGVVSIGDVVKHRLDESLRNEQGCTSTLPGPAITDDVNSGADAGLGSCREPGNASAQIFRPRAGPARRRSRRPRAPFEPPPDMGIRPAASGC